MYGWSYHRVTLDNLIAFAWSAPMRELAAQVGLSDVGLKKLLKSHGVFGPPQGHWNRGHAGRSVPEPPAAPARGPGKRPYIQADRRLAHLPEANFPSSAGPFALAKVPEDLEELRTQTLKAVGRPASAAKITKPHPAIWMLLAQDEKEQAKAAGRKAGVYNRYIAPRPDPKRSASVKLGLTVGNESWQDNAAGTLESKIAEITADLLEAVKATAARKGMPYQRFIRQALEQTLQA